MIHSSKNTPLGWIDQVNHTKYATTLVNRLNVSTPPWRFVTKTPYGKTIDEMMWQGDLGRCSSSGGSCFFPELKKYINLTTMLLFKKIHIWNKLNVWTRRRPDELLVKKNESDFRRGRSYVSRLNFISCRCLQMLQVAVGNWTKILCLCRRFRKGG